MGVANEKARDFPSTLSTMLPEKMQIMRLKLGVLLVLLFVGRLSVYRIGSCKI